MKTDTIKEGPVFYLGGPVEIAGTVDHETGSASYSIAFAPDESAAIEDNDSQKNYWQNIRTYQKKLHFCTRFDFVMKQDGQKISRKGKLRRIRYQVLLMKRRNGTNRTFILL